jgi:hypothetical protein
MQDKKPNIKTIAILFFAVYFFAWGLGGCNKAEANTLKINSNQKIKLDKNGDVFYKWPYKWKFSYAMDYWKEKNIQEISYNTRLGNSALRFEMEPGSCGKTHTGWDDCKNGSNGSERYEMLPYNKDKSIGLNGNTWITMSFFIKEFTDDNGHNSVVQFHNDGDWMPMFNWSIENGLMLQRRTACNTSVKRLKMGCSAWDKGNYIKTVLSEDEVFNQWNDIVFNINFTTKDTGFLKMWINGKLVYHYVGPIKPPNKGGNYSNNSAMQFGIYRHHDIDLYEHTQVHYYDEIRYAKKKCAKLKLEDLGYSCSDLEKQEMVYVDTIQN